MSPFKSSSGRNLGKLIESFKSSNMGSGLDTITRTAGKKFDAVFTGGYNKVDDTSGNFYFYIFTSPGTITLQTNGLSQNITTKYAVIGGGASAPGYNSGYPGYTLGYQGNPSSAFGSTALGGGVGGSYNPGSAGADGGSGGGGGAPNNAGGAGEGFPSPTQQGHPGGTASGTYGGGGGGGAGEEGQNATGSNPGTSGRGGDGIVLEVDKADGSSNGSLLPTSYGTPHPSIPGRWFAGGGGGGGGGNASDVRGGYGGGGYGVNGGDPNYDTQPLAFGHANTGGGGGGWDGPGGGGGGAGGGGAGGVVQGTKTWTSSDYNQTYLIDVGEGGAKTDCAPTTEGNRGGSGIVIIRFPKQISSKL